MRRPAVLAVLLALAMTACSAKPAFVGHGREDSWRQVADPLFVADASFGVAGLVAPGEGYAAWTAVGSVRDAGVGRRRRAVVWSSPDGGHWARADLDDGGATDSVASAGARRQGLAVVVGAVTTPLGQHDARMWALRDGSSWSPLPFDGGPGQQTLTSVAAGPLGFVAAGVDRQTGHAVPAVWWSADGWSWARAGLGPGSPFQNDQSISALAVGRFGAVAVGTLDTSGDTDGMAWFSADGLTWRTVPLGAAGFTGRAAQTVRAVTATTDGFVAVGDDADGERRVAVTWTTADGVTWRRQPASPDMAELPGLQSTGGVSAGSVAGSGPLLAAGGGYTLQLWSSPDGRRWTRAEAPVQDAGADAGALVATDGRATLLLTGTSGLWYRAPGASWSRVSSDPAVFPSASHSSAISSIARSGERLMAFGTVDGEIALWISADGRSWARRPDPGGVFAGGFVDGVAASDGLLVAVGTARPSPGVRSVAAVWTSADHGDTWARADPANPAFSIREVTQMFDVTAGGAGFVAVGLTYTDEVDAQAWFSADGRTWQRAIEPAAWSGPGDQGLAHVCSLPGGGVVAIGVTNVRGEATAWAWRSDDGRTWERVPADASPALAMPGAGFLADCGPSPAGALVSGEIVGAGGMDGALWRTVDGRIWTAVGDPATFATPDNDALIAVASDGPRIVVSAHAGGDDLVYGSTDGGATWSRRDPAGLRGFGDKVGGEVLLAGDEAVLAGHDGSAAAVWIGPVP